MRSILPLLLLVPLLLLPNRLLGEDPFTFRGDRMASTFTKGQERTLLTGNARIVSGNLEIQAETIELSGKAFRYASCKGKVVVRDTKKNIVLMADSMEYDRTLKTSRFLGKAQMEDTEHGVTVRADLFDYSEESEKMTIQSGIRIFKGELICRSDFAVYDRKADSLELSGLPVVTKKRDTYKAGTIRVNLKTEDVLLDGSVSGTITPETKEAPKPDPAP